MAMTRLQELEYDLAKIEDLIELGNAFVAEGYPMAAMMNEANRITREIIKRKIKELQNNDEGRD